MVKLSNLNLPCSRNNLKYDTMTQRLLGYPNVTEVRANMQALS